MPLRNKAAKGASFSRIGPTSLDAAICHHCGKQIKKDKYQRKFCDSKCFGKSLRVERVEKPCPVCGKLRWYRKAAQARACKGKCVAKLCKQAWKEGKFSNRSEPSEETRKRLGKALSNRLKIMAKTGELEQMRLKAKIARGLEDHVSAKQWTILDPANRRYTVSNLQEWCRQNTHLFQDKNPSSKMPFGERISAGLIKTIADNESVYYQGWRVISKSEH